MTTPRPVGYRQVAARLRDEIRSGRLRPGARLPSETEMGVIYGVAVTTGRRAIRLLQDEGLVDVRHGYPTRVAIPPERTVRRFPRGSVFSTRPPTAEERDEHGPTWMTDVDLFGRHLGAFPADRTSFTIA